MKRKLAVFVAFVLVSTSVLLTVGCASDARTDEKPYALTGASATNGGLTYAQQVDRNRDAARGHYRRPAAECPVDGVNGR